MIYKQIPLAELIITSEESHGKRRKIIKKEICVCPFCKEKTHCFKTNAMMYGHTSGGNISSCQVSVNIQYCLNCRIPLIHPNEERHYEYKNQKYELYRFPVPKNAALKEIQKQIFLEPVALSGKSKRKKADDHQTSDKIEPNRSAAHGNASVVGKKLKGQYEIHNDQTCTNTVDVDNSETTNKILKSVSGSVMLFKVDIKGIGEKEFIVTTKAEAVTEDGSVILDSDPFAEELKTAAFAQERNLEGYYQNRIFTMLSVAFHSNKESEVKKELPSETNAMQNIGSLHKTSSPDTLKKQQLKFEPKKKKTVARENSNEVKPKNRVLESKKLRNEAADARFQMDRIASAIVDICIRFKNSEIKDFIITAEKYGSLHSEQVLPYTGRLARELLTAAFYPTRLKKGKYKGREFNVKRVCYPNNIKSIGLKEITTESIHIKSGGGMYSSLTKKAQIVDLLVYSPYTDCYEILRATLIPDKKWIYTDISLYREFVANYGKPPIDVHFSNTENNGNGWNSLQPESLLKEYGYNVSAADGFTDKYRQELLAEIVDLEILSASHICHLLNFFIDSHPARNYADARGKWKRDKYFIENYRVNPSRFLILKK